MLGAVFGVAMFLLLTGVVSQAVVILVWSLTAGDYSYADYYREAFAFERPVGMVATNLGIATLIPIAWVLMAGVHQVRPRWLSSVKPRIRWPYLLGSLVVAVVALNGVLALSVLIDDEDLRFAPQPGLWQFLVVILLTSPLQAIAEEVFFRGYLMQALGSLVAQPWFGVVVSALVFALLHGVQNPALFTSRLAFGLLAGVLVWRTGGLEAGIAAHIVNNVFAYGIAGFTTLDRLAQGHPRDHLGRRGVRRRRLRAVRGAGVRAVPAAAAAQPGRLGPASLAGLGVRRGSRVKLLLASRRVVIGPGGGARWGIG